MIELFDTHCHVQFDDYPLDPGQTIKDSFVAGVNRLLLVGCTLPDSQAAVSMAANSDGLWASIGLHPHEGSVYVSDTVALQSFRDLANKPKVVAVGETGLDYYYNHFSKQDQHKLLRFQLDLAVEDNLPVIFHVREAFEDFWEILSDYPNIRGVVHSFTAGQKELDQILSRGLYVGLNGIMTFTKNALQLDAAKAVPLDKLLLETDSPYLTPVPFRGKVNRPEFTVNIAQFLADLRGEDLQALAKATTANAKKLFNV